MKEIRYFIHVDNIIVSNKATFIRIMASFVDLSPLSSKNKKIGDDWKSLIPKAVLYIANNSRLHEGEKLCKRGIRHAMDKASPAILQSTISLCTYNHNRSSNNNNSSSISNDDNTVIRIKKKVKPSMKEVLYETDVCFNYDSLIACSCTCRVERNFCTHGASILIGLTLLLVN